MRSYRLIGHIAFLVLLVLSVIFFMERTTFVDPGKQVFDMVNKGWFVVFVKRHSMVVNQVLPVIGIKAGASLRTIMLLYSVSFILVYYACFLLCSYGFKNLPAAMAITGVPLVVREVFAHSISETWLAIGYCALFYAWINHSLRWRRMFLREPVFYAIALVLILLNYFLHPVTLFLLGFALAYTVIDKRGWTEVRWYVLGALLLILYGYKFIYPATSHEEGFFSGLRHAGEYLPHFFSLPAIQFVGQQFRGIYVLPFILLLLLLIHYFRQRAYMKLLFLLGFLGLFELILAVTFHRNDGNFANETRLMPFIFFIIIPFFNDLVKHRPKTWIAGLVSVMLVVSCVKIYRTTRQVYTPRVEYYKQIVQILQQQPHRKFVTDSRNLENQYLFSWGCSIETLLISSVDGPERSVTLYQADAADSLDPVIYTMQECYFMHTNWWPYYPMKKLNKKYFGLDCSPYTRWETPIPFRKDER